MGWLFKRRKNKKADTENAHILVLGNRGSGKTSLLATMLYNMDETYNPAGGISLKSNDEKTKNRLAKSVSDMEKMFTSKGELEVGDGIMGTNEFADYNFQLSFTDEETGETLSNFDIVFHDYAGGVLSKEKSGRQHEKLQELFLKSKVIYILVDTPYLMEVKSKMLEEYSAKKEILELFQMLQDDPTERLLAFVPTKCEFYLRNGRIDEVKKRIQSEFKEIISYIDELNKKKPRYRVYFTPVQTTGGIEFCRMDKQDDVVKEIFRRTKPNSRFEPVNTDLLLLLCMDYLFGDFFGYAIQEIPKRSRKRIIKKLGKMDKMEGTDYTQQVKKKKNGKIGSNVTDKELGDALYHFFAENDGNRQSRIEQITKLQNAEKCYKVFEGRRKIRDGQAGEQFEKYFTEIYM